MTRKTSRWDAADTLETKADIAAYLDTVLEDGDPDLLKAALGDIARAKGPRQGGCPKSRRPPGSAAPIPKRRNRRTVTQSSRPSPKS
jgi:hypothetical protein